jgi:hypothetical protein
MKNRAYTKFINLFPNNTTNSRYRRGMKDVKTGLTSEFSKRYQDFERTFKNKYARGLEDD